MAHLVAPPRKAKGKIERRFGTFQRRLVTLLAPARARNWRPSDEVLQLEITRQNRNGTPDPALCQGAGPDVSPDGPAPYEVIRASDGAHYMAGDFNYYAGQPRPALVRLLPDPAEKLIAAGFAADSVEAWETNSTANVLVPGRAT